MSAQLPGWQLVHAGKVRELYDAGPGKLLMVATDAISAFDQVLPTPIPDKGKVLTQLSRWWFDQLDCANHLISSEVPSAVEGRALVVQTLDMIEVECVARGYLTGSGWQEYQQSGTVCGIELPSGLRDGDRLTEPIFTPAIKAPVGEHDENADFATIIDLLGEELAQDLRARTLEIYRQASEIALARGIILADTKLEFGREADGTVVLADEVLTPDSSRFWDAQSWEPGHPQPSFDKQYVRDWLLGPSGWDHRSEPPALPSEVVSATRERYLQAYLRLTGQPLEI